jgi:hypothetical protein
MDYPEQEKFSHPGITQTLLDTLEMALEGDETDSKYGWYNGLLFSIEPLSAEQAGHSITPQGSTIAGHADHILLTLQYVGAMLRGQPYQADWGRSWHQPQLRQPSQAEWNQLKSDLRQEYQALREFMQNKPFWREPDLAAAINNIAHTAYHASAIRQILKASQG